MRPGELQPEPACRRAGCAIPRRSVARCWRTRQRGSFRILLVIRIHVKRELGNAPVGSLQDINALWSNGAACEQVREVCHLVARRSAALAAAATGGLLRVMGRDGKHIAMQPTAIVVDGGLFEHYTAFRGCELRLVGRHVARLHSFYDGSATPSAPIACRHDRN